MDLFAWWWLISLSKNSAKLMLKTIKAWKNPLGTYSKMTKFSFMRNFELSQGGSGQQVWWIFETLRCNAQVIFQRYQFIFNLVFRFYPWLHLTQKGKRKRWDREYLFTIIEPPKRLSPSEFWITISDRIPYCGALVHLFIR